MKTRFSRVAALFALFFITQFLVQSVNSEDTLNIFIIPHSHCDPGWLNTFEGYFRDQVRRILSGVTRALADDPEKRFVWAEISFFHLWWKEQPQSVRDEVQKIVKNGQLEFVAGGWVQNDEANANFDIVIDQVTEGHEFLHRTFGVIPRVAWQIDPFGHSSLTPSLFARMGFEGLVINRIHYGLKDAFKRGKQMEFLWQGSQSVGKDSEIFTHVLHTHYSAPKGYDWEEGSPGVSDHNVQERSQHLVNSMKDRAQAYRTRNLLVTFGDDFKFQNAQTQFGNMDQIIRHINSRTSSYGVKIQYGTVSMYFDAVNAAAQRDQVKFPTYGGDFFPYADNEDAYWTGYYTTRPFLKGHSRATDSILRAAEGMYALGKLQTSHKNTTEVDVNWNEKFAGLLQARRDAALVQHHDGITGTAKQFVADDYASRLTTGINVAQKTIAAMAEIILTKDVEEAKKPVFDALQKFSFANKNEVYSVVVHNPLAWTRKTYVKVSVDSSSVSVTNSRSVATPAQILPTWAAASDIKTSSDTYDLYFYVEVPPLGLETYFITHTAVSKVGAAHDYKTQIYARGMKSDKSVETYTDSSELSIENEHVQLKLGGAIGLATKVYNKDVDQETTINQNILDYSGYGGAYIMRISQLEHPYNHENNLKIFVVQGSAVSQACVHIFGRVNQNQNGQQPGNDNQFPETTVCYRVYSSKGLSDQQQLLEIGGFIEISYNLQGKINKETVIRYSTDLETEKVFFTDNGLEIRRRQTTSPVTEKNYYPSLSMLYIHNDVMQLSVVSSKAMGVHSHENGAIEHMIHRALGQDDGRGLSEPNNDRSRIDVTTYLVVQPREQSIAITRRLALMLEHVPRMVCGVVEGSVKQWRDAYKTSYTPLQAPLPLNTHMLSFKARDGITSDIIARFINVFEVSQHDTLSQQTSLVWDKLFSEYSIDTKRERSLSLSQDARGAKKRKPVYLSAAETLPHASGLSPDFKAENQNTEEEGVFISKAALEEQEKAKQEAERKAQEQQGGKKRSLLAFEDDVDEEEVQGGFTLKPMQIKSYFLKLTHRFAVIDVPLTHETPSPNEPEIISISPESSDTSKTIDGGKGGFTEEDLFVLLIISIVCTFLVVVAYMRLSRGSRKEYIQVGGPGTNSKSRKEIMYV